MRQILCNSQGARVVRMPRPVVEAGSVLVHVRYSMISVGTEIAALRPSDPAASTAERSKEMASLAQTYLRAALHDPGKAVRRATAIAKGRLAQVLPTSAKPPARTFPPVEQIDWTACVAQHCEQDGQRLDIVTDDSAASYQAMSQVIELPPHTVPIVEVRGTVHEGAVAIGLLNEAQDAWLGIRTLEEGVVEDRLVFDPGTSRTACVVIANAGLNTRSRLRLDALRVQFMPPTENGLPHSELDDQGWNVGYAVTGEVIGLGAGVEGIRAGDLVACGGAGQANHAEYVSVKKNLVCRIPDGCSATAAASATVGSIAMQGVRRASPQLGETVCVLGLGLIGQLTVQLLRAAGCVVIGMDLDAERVARAKTFGMEEGAPDPDLLKQLIRDRTHGHGADRTLITAASKSEAVINLAMEATRAKGTVVIVGDVSLNIERAVFYRKEINLLMSTSYGPGRYDRAYEEDGQDYPLSYVRWTLNRNMQSYLALIAAGRLDVDGLIDLIVPIDEAPEVYKALAHSQGNGPLGILIEYPEDSRPLPEPPQATRITIRGHKKPPADPQLLQYALVGAGAFGTSMLVPQMQKRKDRFFLRGLVSRDTTRGGNFARANRVETLTTQLETVLHDPNFSLIVIATRHHEHADQVVACLKAKKHVFVEKPLALSWQELDRVVKTYQGLEQLEQSPLLMVGFNRRFSPALQALKAALDGRRSPLMMHYRLNGGYIPPDSWIQGPQGGGRNLGEACHMYDVFRFLADRPLASVNATCIDPASLAYQRNDNFCATLAYQDGSVGNLVYTALGSQSGLAKERIEVFCDGDAYIVDDFKRVSRAGDGQVLWRGEVTDKGHFEELSRFGDAIAHRTEAPIPFEQLVETTAVALHVEDLLAGRGGEDAG